MASNKQDSSNRPFDPEGPISPVDFTPLSKNGKSSSRSRQWLWPLTGICVLTTFAALWFLSTARAVVLEVVPSTATVNIDGGFRIRLADHFLMRPGNYQLEAKASGYQTHQQALLVDRRENQRHRIALARLPGHLNIETLPAGAIATIDNKVLGSTPVSAKQLSPGEHQLTLRHPRYLPAQHIIDIEGLDRTQSLEVKLEPAWGSILIASEPSGASIRIADEQQGLTPATVIAVDGQELVLNFPGRKAWKKTINIAPGEEVDLGVITLAPADAELHITTQPAGASITVDRQYRGTSPLKLELSPDQNHPVSLFLAGYSTVTRTLKLASGAQEKLNISLVARLGTVDISIQPPGSRFYIDGKLQNTIPESLQLPARPHLFRVEKNGFVGVQKTLTPKPGITQSLRFALQTPEQLRLAAIPATVQSPAGQTLKLFRPDARFTMGAPRREQGRRANEVQHPVSLSRAFYLGVKEVSNTEFKKYRASHSSGHVNRNTLDTGSQPVVRVSWVDAALYCNWLSEQEGLTPFYRVESGNISVNTPKDVDNARQGSTGYRLPTEAEWSWAARVDSAGRVLKFPWGNHFPPGANTANIADDNAQSLLPAVLSGYRDGFSASAPVGSFPANRKGLFDLGGNVSEWVHDYYGISFNTQADTIDPLGPVSGQYRVIRGSSWRHGRIIELRSSHRGYAAENKHRDDLGFRIARYLE